MTTDAQAPTSAKIEEKVAQFQRDCHRMRDEMGKMMVGQRPIIDGVLITMLSGGNVLLEGVPGLGKTMLVRTLSETLGLAFSRIQFTPDLMPTDILGTTMIVDDEKGGKHFKFERGPIFANIVLADEINRATPKTQAAMLEAMQERSVTIGKETMKLDDPHFVLATQNPLEMEGTYPLPEAQLDRFLFKLDVPFPSSEDLKAIVDRTTEGAEAEPRQVLSGERILSIRALAREIRVADHLKDRAILLLESTHPKRGVSLDEVERFVHFGASPR